MRANCAAEANTAPPVDGASQAPAASGQELDEHTVATVAAHLLRGLIADDERCSGKGGTASMYGSELTHQALAQLEGLTARNPGADASIVFHVAAAMTAGALAHERETKPEQLERHEKLVQVFQVLDTASISYSLDQGPCEALAVGLQAGAKHSSDQPRPPIRRVAGVHRYSHVQLQTAMEVVAGQMATLDQMLIFLQCRGEDAAAQMVLDSAQALVSHIGGVVDTLCGEEIRGGMERWQFGPNFADQGKAGAA